MTKILYPKWFCFSQIYFRLPLDNHGIDDDFREAPQLMNLGYMTAFETLNSLKRKSKKR